MQNNEYGMNMVCYLLSKKMEGEGGKYVQYVLVKAQTNSTNTQETSSPKAICMAKRKNERCSAMNIFVAFEFGTM